MRTKPVMNLPRYTFLMIGLVVLASLSVFSQPVEAAQPSGYDLAAAVNAYRAANGYYQLNHNSLVASAAQTHAEWIVATGQGGHIGAGGSDETMRVSWTGYGGGASIQCDENWSSGGSIEDAVYGAWTDWVHQEVMLNQWGNLYTDIGGGVAEQSEGYYVFVLNVCKVIGQEYDGTVPDSSGSAPDADPAAAATADFSNYIYGVTLATPLADGSIKHTVLYGQTLASIAEAYGVSIETLRELNDMAADDSVIWVEQELLIQPGTGTDPGQDPAAPETDTDLTPSPTAEDPTPTPRPTRTLVPTQATASPQEEDSPASDSLLLRNLGLVLVVVCGGGLAVYLYFSSKGE